MMNVMRMQTVLKKSIQPIIGRRGMSGGFLKKTIWVEENAGLRENSYKTWELNLSTGTELATFLFIPFTLLFFFFKEDMTELNRQVGKNNNFGANPFTDEE